MMIKRIKKFKLGDTFYHFYEYDSDFSLNELFLAIKETGHVSGEVHITEGDVEAEMRSLPRSCDIDQAVLHANSILGASSAEEVILSVFLKIEEKMYYISVSSNNKYIKFSSPDEHTEIQDIVPGLK